MKRFFAITMLAILVAGCKKEDGLQDPVPVTLDFENATASYLAGPTSYGANLYAEFGASQYTSYTDTETGLRMGINADADGARNFWNGGIAISRWNDMTAAGYTNQCSVYHADASTGFGGHNGSKTFAVNNGNGEISFATDATEATFDHFWVTNNTYAVLSMKNGDDMAKKFEAGDWFRLTISAEDKSGSPTGTPVEFYLADLRTASSPGIVTEWTKVDLSPLGARVHKIKFVLDSSDAASWGGFNTPAYFCFDDLTFTEQ